MNKVGLCRNPRLLRGCCCRFCYCCLNLSLSSYFSHVNHPMRAPIVPTTFFSLRPQPSTCRSWSYKGKLVIELGVSISRNSLINNAALLSDVCILDTRQVTNYGWYPLKSYPKKLDMLLSRLSAAGKIYGPSDEKPSCD